MLLMVVPVPVLATNCYVLAAGPGSSALVVDPGAGAAEVLPAVLAAHDLAVGAVAVTHGHADHLWDAAAVAGPAAVHLGAPDHDRLEDPAGALGPGPLAAMFGELAGTPWRRPEHVRAYPDGPAELVPGVVVEAVPAPGHTPGSTLLLVAGVDGEDALLTGDVLFAGSVGRTDLPGGDEAVMAATLRRIATDFADGVRVLPGHGPATTIGAERAANPYLRAAQRG